MKPRLQAQKKPLIGRREWGILLLVLMAVTVSYSNHFHNAFHFDDFHSIVNNLYVRDIRNLPLFFTDARTLSSLPQNQIYRPLWAASVALDFWFAGGKQDPFFFHLSMFAWYLIFVLILFLLYRHLLDRTGEHEWNGYIALFAAALYALHTAHAETINYISARSDEFSTLWLVLSLLVYVAWPRLRKYQLYLLAAAIAALFKQTALMLAPILFCYILLFETDFDWKRILRRENWNALCACLLKAAPAIALCAVLYWLQGRMLPASYTPGIFSTYNYMITQPFVLLRYFTTFFLPIDLSADSDWKPLASIWDITFFLGIGFIVLMIVAAFLACRSRRGRPIAFGIFWFFLAHIPTSSIVPLSEVMNDHRMFFPDVGLTLAVCWAVGLLIFRFEPPAARIRSLKVALVSAAFIIPAAYGFGTYQRNKVWKNEESLWKDVTNKSPGNGRGLMNYGLTLMGKGDYAGADEYYRRAEHLTPNYSYLHVNMAILKAARNDPSTAERYFRKAADLDPGNPEMHYYFAKFLLEQRRTQEAIAALEKAITLSRGHMDSWHLLMQVYAQMADIERLKNTASGAISIQPEDQIALFYLRQTKNWKTRLEAAEAMAKSDPSPENYLSLSLEYHNAGRYEDCIGACFEALKLRPLYAEAYNNICSAHNQLGRWEKARDACEQALKIRPQFELARGNLNWALQHIRK